MAYLIKPESIIKGLGNKVAVRKKLLLSVKIKFEYISDDNPNELYHKEIPYISRNPDQKLIVIYSPKYAAYQHSIRQAQVDMAKDMLQIGTNKNH